MVCCRNRHTPDKVARLAYKILIDPNSSSALRSVAGFALTQAPNDFVENSKDDE